MSKSSSSRLPPKISQSDAKLEELISSSPSSDSEHQLIPKENARERMLLPSGDSEIENTDALETLKKSFCNHGGTLRSDIRQVDKDHFLSLLADYASSLKNKKKSLPEKDKILFEDLFKAGANPHYKGSDGKTLSVDEKMWQYDLEDILKIWSPHAEEWWKRKDLISEIPVNNPGSSVSLSEIPENFTHSGPTGKGNSK